jgi:putative spermidine/putrescine transport system ATP-binding protein
VTTLSAFAEFRDVDKTYDGRVMVVERLNCAVEHGEFLTFLGPSGSGKTTALMMLAGFEEPSAGELRLNGRSLAHVPPHRRNMGVVFQNYALFPHLSVAENLAFPLSVRKVSARKIRERVQQVLALVRLEGYEQRRPAQLSGGQQQRVALARALIFGPELILMDEPLGALDKQLREQLQTEIKQIHRHLGVTVIYVTHDQSEALSLSDRIALFRGGSIRQLGTPNELYEQPADSFVAQFIGQNNSLRGVVEGIDGNECIVQLTDGLRIRARHMDRVTPGVAVTAWIRPEHIVVAPGDVRGNELTGRIQEVVYQGDHLRVRVALAGTEIIVKSTATTADRLQPGATTRICFSPEDCHAFLGNASDATAEYA